MNTSIDDDLECNPYTPPKARLDQDTVSEAWSAEPRWVPAMNGLLWWWQAGRIAAARPRLWAGALCLAAVVPTFLALIFNLGLNGTTSLLVGLYWVLWPVLTGGIVGAAHKQRQGETIRLRDIFTFFRSWLLFLGWSGVGFCVSGLMLVILGLLRSLLIPTLSQAMTAAAARPILPFVSFAVTLALLVGNVFIAAAASLRGEWPLRVLFRAGLMNTPAFLLNLAVLTPIVWALELLGGFIVWGQAAAPPILTRLWMTTEYALIWFGLALTAYAAVRDIFYNEE